MRDDPQSQLWQGRGTNQQPFPWQIRVCPQYFFVTNLQPIVFPIRVNPMESCRPFQVVAVCCSSGQHARDVRLERFGTTWRQYTTRYLTTIHHTILEHFNRNSECLQTFKCTNSGEIFTTCLILLDSKRTQYEFLVFLWGHWYLCFGPGITLCPWVLKPGWIHHRLHSLIACVSWSSELSLARRGLKPSELAKTWT